ncbi:MAG: DUF4142 domain-containing protein [Pseudomonadota bacterium]
MAHANPIQIQKYLKGVDYPASKAALIENARNLGADESVCASLEQLPDEDFQTPAEVSQAFKGPSEDHAERAGPRQGAGGSDAPGPTGGNEFLTQAMEDSMAQIELCVAALKKSANAELRSLAQTMIDEHGKLGQEMEQLAKEKNLAIPAPQDPRHSGAAKMQRLSGREFERRFVETSLRDHENSLKVFQHYAGAESDRKLKALAGRAEKMIDSHLKMFRELEKKLAK